MKTINMQNLKKIKNRKVNYNKPNIKDQKKNPKTTTNNFF